MSSAFSQSNIAAGQGSSLTITLRNTSGTALNVPAFTMVPIGVDTATSSSLQAQASAVVGSSSVSLGTTCPATTVTRIDGNLGIKLSSLTLGAGANCTVTVPFVGSIGVLMNKVVTITPKAATVSSGSAAVSVAFTANNSVSLWNNFQLTKAGSPKYVVAGDPVFFEIQINNFAGQAINGLTVSDKLQSNSAMVNFPGWTASTGLSAWTGINTSQAAALGGCTVASVSGPGSYPVFTLNNVPLNGICTLGFWGVLPKDIAENATPINSLELGAVSWVNPSGFTVANASQASTQMQVIAPLAISAAFTPANAAEGTPVMLSFILGNSSAGIVSNLGFSTALPLTASGNQLRVATPANASTTCAGGSVTAVAGSNMISLSGGSLPARIINPNIVGKNQASTCTVSVQVVGPADTYTLALPKQALSGSGNYAIDGSPYTPKSSSLTLPAPASLTYNLALTTSKAFSPAIIGDGGQSTVKVSLGNSGSAALSNLTVNDPLPPYMTVASPANASSTCAGASVTAVPGAASVTMSGGSLATGSSCQLVFDVVGSGAAPWVNTIAPGGVTASGGIQNLLPISATLANSTPPSVVVNTTLSPSTLAMPGQSSVLTIQLQNKSPVALSNLRLNDYFTLNGTAATAPGGMQLFSPSNLSSTCAGAVLAAAGDGGSFSMNGASLPFGGSCTITAKVTSSKVGTVVNVIPVQAVASNEGISNPTGTTTSLSAGGHLDVVKSFSPALVRPGVISRLRLALSHVTPVALANLALTDNLPAGLVVATPANAVTTCSGGSVTTSAGQVRLTGAAMPAATSGLPASCAVEVDVVAGSEGHYQNTLQVGDVTGSFDGGPASNWVAASAALEVRSAILIFKNFTPAMVARQVPTTATITLGNSNTIGLTAVRLVDTLPPNLMPAPIPNATTTCPGGSVAVDALAGTVTLNGATLPASGSCKIKVDVVSNVPGSYINSIAAHTLQDNEGVDNDLPASATLTVLQPPTLVKQFSAPQIRQGGVSTLILALGNDNSTGLNLTADLADVLPVGMTVAAIPNLGGSCQLGQVTALAGATMIRYASGASVPAGGCTIQVDVTAAAEGSYSNVIPAGALLTTAGGNALPATASLTVNPLGVISGKVFLDSAAAPNGIYDSGKPGIANVVLRLSGTSYGPDGVAGGGDDVPVNLQTITDASGSYSFNGLMAGQYTVTLQDHPSNTVTGITSAGPVLGGGGGSSGTASAVMAWPSNVSGIILLIDGSGRTASSSGNNFAALPQASVAGRVYADSNNNGIVDAGETGIANVTVQLAGVDWAGNPVMRSTLTMSDGRYQFANLPPSNPAGYTLTEIQPAGYLDGKTTVPAGQPGVADSSKPVAAGGMDAIHGVVVQAGETLKDYHFAEVPTLLISGRVFADANNNGVVDAGENGIADVPIQLSGKDGAGNPVTRSVVTASDGRYSFDNLPPSDAAGYTLTEIQPAGHLDGKTSVPTGQPGVAESSKPVAPGGTDVIRGIVAVAGDALKDYNFGEIAAAQVSGRVYADSNNNGVVDAGETGIANVTVQLAGVDWNGNPVTRSTLTMADGRYQFANLPPANPAGYTLTEIQPTGYLDGKTTVPAGQPGVAASSKPVAAGGMDAIHGVVVQAGETLKDYNFAEVPTLLISGRVFADANNDGVVDAGENGIANVPIQLSGKDGGGNAVTRSVVTASDGRYSFDNLPPSDAAGYTLTEIQPAAYLDGKTRVPAGQPGVAESSKPVVAGGTDVIRGIVAVAGDVLKNYNFGETAVASISGRVFADANNNGVVDADETGIANVTVQLAGVDWNGNPVTRNALTMADGRYQFTNLPPSGPAGYSLTEIQPSGYLDGKTSVPTGKAGLPDGSKPLAAGAADVIRGVVLQAGEVLADYNFAEIPTLLIAGRVYSDANNNGVVDAGENGIANVQIRLAGKDGAGNAVVRSTLTDAAGLYSFDNLPPSDASGYTLTEVQPAGYLDGRTTVPGGQPGLAGSVKPVAVAGADTIGGIVARAGDVLRDYNFGEVPTLSISGRVFVDRNNNGVVDADEPGIANVTIQLGGKDVAGNTVQRSVLTGADGVYRFDNLPPSDVAGYTLTEIQPATYPDGKTSLPTGQPGVAAAGKPVAAGGADIIRGILAHAGDVLGDYNFGELADPVLQRPIINGYVYLNADHSGVRPQDGAQAGISGWTVQLVQNATPVCNVQSDAQGFYQFDNLHCPGYQYSGLPTGSGFDITFLSNGNVAPATATSGNNRGDVSVVGKIMGITLAPGEQVVEQNLPLDPSGVVYDAQTRRPVAGVTVTLSGPAGFDPARHLVGGQASQVTGTNGFYQFLLQNGFPPGGYRIAVLAPPPYQPGTATSMPACHGSLTIGPTPVPALVQSSNGAPGAAMPVANPAACVGIVAGGASSTQYYLGFGLSATSAPIFNNHLPVDKAADGVLTVFKSTSMVRASRGDLVPYVITVVNNKRYPVSAVNLLDQMPPGFKYRRGSASLDHVPLEPVMEGRVLAWRSQNFQASEKKTYRLTLVVGTGVEPGDYVNQAWAVSMDQRMLSGIAQASTRVVAEPTLDCPDLIGKVFEDRNGNGYQDPGEPGLAGVRLVTPRGMLIHSDDQGRFHVPCPELPHPDRGSNFVLKLDTRTLPEGYRLSTDNPASVRLTRGKTGKISFGAVRYRILQLNLADAAFVPGLGDLLAQWDAQLDLLVARLQEAPSIVQLHYVAPDHGPAALPGLIMLRLQALRERLMGRWQAVQGPYLLHVEIDPIR